MLNTIRKIVGLLRGDQDLEPSSGDVVVEVPTGHINIGPVGFHQYAVEYQLAAKAIPLGRSISPIPYYLLCRSLELGLKAYLLSKGFSQDELKKIGHNLSKLLNVSKREGIDQFYSLSKDEVEAIRRANIVYKSKAFEYFDLSRILSDFRNLPELDKLATITDNVLTSIKQECIDRSRSG